MSTVTKETFWTQIVEDPTLYGTITTDDNLFNYRSDAVWQVMNETFIANGGVFEVTKWEEMLGLTSEETSLNNRKANILNHITENLPITIGILEQLIKDTTDNNYEMIFDKQNSSLIIECFEKDYNSIVSFIPRVIPGNFNVEYVFNDNELPFGYLRAEFWENTISNWSNASYIETEWLPENGQNVILEGDVQVLRQRGSFFVAVVARNRLWPNAIGFYHQDGNFITVRGYNNGRQLDRWLMNCLNKRVKIKLVQQKLYIDGESLNYSNYGGFNVEKWGFEPNPAIIGRQTKNINPSNLQDSSVEMRHYEWCLYDNTTPVRHYIPVLSVAGVPCMYDTVNKQTAEIQNLSACVLGFTLEQARKLGRLSESGGAMKISLPTGYDTDAEVMNALDAARSKGWTLTIQTYEDTSTTSTYSMRRIWVRKTEDENGNYVDSDGNRFIVDWCVDILSPENKSPENYGYESFRNKESAIEYWGLTEWIDPEMEELTGEQN